MQEKVNLTDSCAASVIRGAGAQESVHVTGRFEAICYRPIEPLCERYGKLKQEIYNAYEQGDQLREAVLQVQLAEIPLEEKWRDSFVNVVTTVGKNDLLDKFLKGAAYTQTIRMGLKGAGSAVVGDTQASHAGWLEQGLANAPTYTGNRKDVVMGAAAAGSSVSPAQVFAITSSGTVSGCFINNGGSATKDDTTGTLYSAGDFTGGDKIVANLDSISVTYTATIT